MAHAQQQILEAVQTVLANGNTAAGDRVFLDRVDALQPGELPAILVDESPDGETAEPFNLHGLEQRQLSVQVRGIVAHGTEAAAQARDLGLEVEKLIAGSTTLAAMAQGGVRIESSRPANEGDGDRLMALREQSWRFTYYVNPEAPDTLL